MLVPGEDTNSSAAATSTGGDGISASGGTSDAGTSGGGQLETSGGNAGSASGSSSKGGASAGNSSGGAGGRSSASGSGGASAGSVNGGSGGASAGAGGSGGSAGALGVDPCSRASWNASASESSLRTDVPQLYNPPAQAIDGDGDTRWSSGQAQIGGEWFLLDLGAVAAHITQIVLDTSNHATDFPAGYKLEVSTDGTNYSLVTSGSGSSLTTIAFSDKSARYLKITQTSTSASWWSIQEISISCQSN